MYSELIYSKEDRVATITLNRPQNYNAWTPTMSREMRDALRDARTGIYSAKALEAISPELREKYFEHAGAQFAFRPDLRRRVIFGRHDITRDAPISRAGPERPCRGTRRCRYASTRSGAQRCGR